MLTYLILIVGGIKKRPDKGMAMSQISIYIVLAGAIALVDVGIQALSRFVNQAQSLVAATCLEIGRSLFPSSTLSTTCIKR